MLQIHSGFRETRKKQNGRHGYVLYTSESGGERMKEHLGNIAIIKLL